MDVLLDFQPFVFGSSSQKGAYVESLPLKTPISDLLATHGRIFGLFSMMYSEVFPLDSVAKEILPYFEQQYYEHETDSVHSHLVAALTATQVYLEKRIMEMNASENVDFSLLVGCVWGSVLYVARCGGSSALRLYRADTFGHLFDIHGLEGSSAVNSMSGFVQPGDAVVLYDASIDAKKFPVTASALRGLDTNVIYSKLSQLFDVVSDSTAAGSVSGFYIREEFVPAPDEDRVVFADVKNERDLDLQSAMNLEEEDELAVGDSPTRTDAPVVFQKMSAMPGALQSFGSKIFSQLGSDPQGRFSFVKRVLGFFSRTRVFILGCMFLILFVGFIVMGRDYENTFKSEKETSQLKDELLPKIEEAYKQSQYYAELNPDRAKKYLQEAKDYLGQFNQEGLQDVEVKKLLQSVQDTYAVVTKTYTFADITPYFDLTVVNQQAAGSKISLSTPYLLISDTVQNAVYQIGIENRSASAIIGRDDVEGLIGAEGQDGIAYAASTRGIVRTEKDSSAIIKLSGPQSEWGTLTDMQVYGGSVYLLDQAKNQIWKYIPEGNGFGPVRNYVSTESPVNLSSAVSFAIDGNVWIGLSTGEVIKLYSGKRDVFSLAALEIPFSSLQSVYTDELTDYLYVLDGTTGRVVVFLKKDGSYVSTYESERFKGASDVVIDSENKQLYILNKNQIYKVEVREISQIAE